MDTTNIPFTLVKWDEVPPVRHNGVTAYSLWHDRDFGEVHVHFAEYMPGYKADGWCTTGHVLYVIQGQLITELKDGREFVLNEGMSYQVSSDEQNPHRSRTPTGAQLFIVDL